MARRVIMTTEELSRLLADAHSCGVKDGVIAASMAAASAPATDPLLGLLGFGSRVQFSGGGSTECNDPNCLTHGHSDTGRSFDYEGPIDPPSAESRMPDPVFNPDLRD